ncbi:hypothetical protein HAX54_025993 [Datura stramonium]|uniref:Uncharacterized protein n=1 Tax=Datura stramonium TaxID=4076 RepID=A0ABS8S6K6_DATST|nr:hypothetical protein [Datura stramonium]
MGEGREEENPNGYGIALRRREGGEAAQGFGGGFAGNYGGLEGKKERRKRGAMTPWLSGFPAGEGKRETGLWSLAAGRSRGREEEDGSERNDGWLFMVARRSLGREIGRGLVIQAADICRKEWSEREEGRCINGGWRREERGRLGGRFWMGRKE